jgi:DNA-binding NarL/FixJ family response regulator
MAGSYLTKAAVSNSTFAGDAAVLRIWLVDDHDSFRELMAKLLNMEPGVKCPRHFPSAESVLLALREQTPDVILLDVEMPGMNGVEAIHAIKKLAPSSTVLMLTTFSDHVIKERCLATGAASYLLKHHPTAEIVAAIRAAKQPGSESNRLRPG